MREAQSQPSINLDFGPLLELLRRIADAVDPAVFVPAVVDALGRLIYGAMRGLFLVIWDGLLLSVPHELSDRFPAVTAMMPNPVAIVAGALTLALALMGVRIYVRGITGKGGILDEILGRICLYITVLGMLPWLIARAIDIEQAVARSVARAALGSIVPDQLPVPFDITIVVSLVFMLLFGVRLWLKLGSNVVHLMVAIVWSPVALVCGLFPESSWVTGLWIREFTGRLAGAVLATVATSLGLALALTQPGLLAVTAAGSAFLAAHDLVDWLARTPGSHMGGALGYGMRMAANALGHGGVTGASAAAIPQNEITTRADMYGYD